MTSSPELVLVADVGGTHSRFGLVHAGELVARDMVALDNDGFPGLAGAIPHYLEKVGQRPVRAVIAVAGPIKSGTVHLTNRRGWSFRPDELARHVGLERIQPVNDFAALAEALPYLDASELRSIGSVQPQNATKVVLGPGTGLGVAALVCRDGEWIAIPSEGGHVEFAPTNEREAAVYAVLRQGFGRVSAELVVSGEGLERLDAAIAIVDGAEAVHREGAEIAGAARRGEARAREVMELFYTALARFAGDMALAFVANGGVYMGGGVIPKTLDFLDAKAFRSLFEGKKPHEGLLSVIATELITTPYPALTGCAAIAARG